MLFSFRQQFQAQIHLSFSAESVRIFRIFFSAVQTSSGRIMGPRHNHTALLTMRRAISGRRLVTILQLELIALPVPRSQRAATERALPGRGILITPASSPAFLQTAASWV